MRSEEFAKASNLHGTHDIGALFPDTAPLTSAPWPSARRLKSRGDYDKGLVKDVLSAPPVVEDVDPRYLHRTQPSITRAGVQHYMDPANQATGKLFADQASAGNRIPVVYSRDGEDLLLSGHHRAAAALLQGRQFKARRIVGGWGAPR